MPIYIIEQWGNQKKPLTHSGANFSPFLIQSPKSFLRSFRVSRTVERFPPFYGTRKFITMKPEVLSDVSTSLDE